MKLKRRLLLGRKGMTNLDSIFKSRDITLPTKVCLVKAMIFPVVMYGCESWTVKKAECRGPASAESRDILRMDDVGEWRKIDKEIKKETWGDQASSSEAHLLYSSWGFYTLSYTYSKVKNAESTQHSISNNFYRYQVPSCKKSYFLYIIFYSGGLLIFHDLLLIKVGQPEHQNNDFPLKCFFLNS